MAAGNLPDYDTDVLIVGAGPTGLVLALWLARLGVRVRIIDKTAEPGTTSRALGVQARTLEFYAQLGIADAVVSEGRWAKAANLWTSGRRRAHIEFGAIGAGLSPFPYALIYPQDEHETLLIARLVELGVVVGAADGVGGISAGRSRGACADREARWDEKRVQQSWLCRRMRWRALHRARAHRHRVSGRNLRALVLRCGRGGRRRSIERRAQRITFDRNDFLVVFPLKQDGRDTRFIRHSAQREQNQTGELRWDDVSKNMIDRLRLAVRKVNWFSTYRVHHRVAEHFRSRAYFSLGGCGAYSPARWAAKA